MSACECDSIGDAGERHMCCVHWAGLMCNGLDGSRWIWSDAFSTLRRREPNKSHIFEIIAFLASFPIFTCDTQAHCVRRCSGALCEASVLALLSTTMAAVAAAFVYPLFTIAIYTYLLLRVHAKDRETVGAVYGVCTSRSHSVGTRGERHHSLSHWLQASARHCLQSGKWNPFYWIIHLIGSPIWLLTK